jgi:hypothetical protein
MLSSGSNVAEAPRRSRLARVTRTLLLVLLTLGLLGVIAYRVLVERTRIDPPKIAETVRAAAMALPFSTRGERSYLGDNWMSRARGIWEIHLQGEPFALGYAHSRLGNRLLLDEEDYMFDEMARYVPSKIALFLIRAGTRLRYRHLADFLPPARSQEIAGLAAGALDAHSDFLPTYHRMVFYHALHDITQSLEHSPLLGCTAFAASGKATTDGHLIIGRNFDFEGPEIFDREKAVLFFKPAGKIPFASVAWTGMTGVVTGINAEKIYVSINAARTEDKGDVGIPVEILLREILENARSIDDVIALVRTPVMVPDLYLVGDGKTGQAVIIERSPTRVEVRHLGSDGTLGLSNHALAPAFSADTKNDHLKRYLTSGARLARLEELLAAERGKITPATALAILRDKRGPGDVALGLGNRNALDAIIATHSVVVDASNLVLWVGAGPHLLGKFVAFDLAHELNGVERPPAPDLPADPTRESDEFAAWQLASSSLKAVERMRKLGQLDRAIDEARRAVAAEEAMPEASRTLGDLLWQANERGDAIVQYRRFLTLHPPYLADIEEVQRRLLEAVGK